MAELIVEVPDRVAEDLVDTIGWVRRILDEGFGLEAAIAEAVVAWVADVRLEFVAVADGGDLAISEGAGGTLADKGRRGR